MKNNMSSFYLTSPIRIKLTKRGIDILKQYLAIHGRKKDSKFELQLDEDGYYEMRLCDVIEIFGPRFVMTKNENALPFSTEIRIGDEYLLEVPKDTMGLRNSKDGCER